MQWGALILYYFHEDYENMDDEKFANRIAQLDFCFQKVGMYDKQKGY